MRVVYNSFNGRYADNPRALHQGLLRAGGGHEHVWLADPRHAATFPGNVRTVPIASPRGRAALEVADLVVANCHTDLDPWRKGRGSVYLQTWHGTPLKAIHRLAVSQPPAEEMDVLDLEISRWDHLISPSPAASELLRAAFGYSGSVLETGYPRNDVLSAPDSEQHRERVRRQLGLADDATVVLYAPTFRDDEVEGDVPLGLDVVALADALGPGYVLLVRQHYYLGHRPRYPDGPGLRDVSVYPDISDLYLAADALVTDYSSALFDFAVTGKPILLHPYDLEHYRDRLRGFTFDILAESPGPVVLDQAELTQLLRDLPGVAAQHAERYDRFRARYCHLDDGHATERVLEQLALR